MYKRFAYTLALLPLLVGAVAVRAGEIRIGVVGLDTFHATQFTQLFNDPKSPGHVSGGRVVAGFRGGSPDLELSRLRLDEVTRQMTEKFGVKLHASIEELVQSVDAIMIESVDGRPHLDQFRRTLGAKKPVFIDKPMTGSLRDAVEIVRLARATGTPCFSSSALRYSPNSPVLQREKTGPVRSVYSYGPAEIEPHHPDLYWYGIHAVEALYAVIGAGCVQVVRTQTDSTDIVTGLWTEGRMGTVQGNRGHDKRYGVTVFGAKATVTGGDKSSLQPLAVKVMEFFQTGIAPVPLEETLELLAFMEAADESKRRGGAKVTIAEVLRAAGAQP
ncbi:MAG: gfo/Idh/MocA family oxidoreductase [Opitutus sp.]|nr:gfo/Idh/MocA family oxidoreductase [Opitutus sp.]